LQSVLSQVNMFEKNYIKKSVHDNRFD